MFKHAIGGDVVLIYEIHLVDMDVLYVYMYVEWMIEMDTSDENKSGLIFEVVLISTYREGWSLIENSQMKTRVTSRSQIHLIIKMELVRSGWVVQVYNSGDLSGDDEEGVKVTLWVK